jgi:hypothetical protein
MDPQKLTNEKTAKVNPLSFWIYIHYTSPQKADGAQLGPRAHSKRVKKL